MPEKEKHNVMVNSEVGELEAVIIHTMGSEVENMTPQNAERALYSDILSLSVAQKEYAEFREVLKKVTRVFEVKDLLTTILKNEKVKENLIDKVCDDPPDPHLADDLRSMEPSALASHLIEGIVLNRDSLTRFLSQQRFSLRPLHNFFFTRDASIAMNDKVLISRMASKVRERETQIMEAIFDYYPGFDTKTIHPDACLPRCEKVSIEGGDVLVAREDLFIIGIGSRTSSAGIDNIIEKLKGRSFPQHIIVQELPEKGESFIHLDMVFTLLSQSECMVYEPVVMQPNRFKTISINIDGKKVNIKEEKNILDVCSKLGLELEPVYCGGTADPWIQEREQWHSGANFLALGPGKIIGYGRNEYTIGELHRHGYEVLQATDVISGNINLRDHDKYVITIAGSELARGGGGARCMSMPVRRKDVGW
jgi:arginine deiminase